VPDIVHTAGKTTADICGNLTIAVTLQVMRILRARVRAIALLWLLAQAASLSAFVPENCCMSHVAEIAAKDAEDACHESEPAPPPEPGDACPMQHDTGAACPMHSAKSTDRCVMSNACNGPGTHLVSLLAFLGPAERPVSSAIVLESSTAFLPASTPPVQPISSVDAPPPKA
jgi:hypothetical protein